MCSSKCGGDFCCMDPRPGCSTCVLVVVVFLHVWLPQHMRLGSLTLLLLDTRHLRQDVGKIRSWRTIGGAKRSEHSEVRARRFGRRSERLV